MPDTFMGKLPVDLSGMTIKGLIVFRIMIDIIDIFIAAFLYQLI